MASSVHKLCLYDRELLMLCEFDRGADGRFYGNFDATGMAAFVRELDADGVILRTLPVVLYGEPGPADRVVLQSRCWCTGQDMYLAERGDSYELDGPFWP